MFTAKEKELVNNVHDYNKILKSRTEMFLRKHPDAKEILSNPNLYPKSYPSTYDIPRVVNMKFSYENFI